MHDLPETRHDSVLAEFTADACRRITTGLLEITGNELRTFLAAEVDELRDVLRDPSRLDGARDPSDPPFRSRKGRTVVNTNPVSSRRNTIAPLLNVTQHEDETVATTVLPVQYQGPRGRVHGGYVGVLLDQVLWLAVNDKLGHASYTRSLTITYENTAPLEQELTVTGRVRTIDGRKTFAEGELVAGDVVCARADGLWLSPRLGA
ncbi:MAG: PaaI family thioesterase [Sciscionella sp.]